ncbi:hypothetical protein GE21DRAFT_1358332 [Neurospora crassa]|nr:hypothetical protein GE21DRAFT_1358332 [Neurospora crassa]
MATERFSFDQERLFLLDEQLSVQLTLVQCISGPFTEAQQQIRQKLAEHSRTTGTAIRKEDSFRIAPVAVAITAVAALLIVAVAAVLPYRSDYSVQVVSDSSTMYRGTALRVTR